MSALLIPLAYNDGRLGSRLLFGSARKQLPDGNHISSQQKMFGEFLIEVGVLKSRILPVNRLPRFPRQFTPLGREGEYHAAQRACHRTFLTAYEGLLQLPSRSPA
jgi:hypothetical protein